MAKDTILTLVERLSEIPDPRIERSKKHKLIDVLVIGVVGTICGGDGWEDIEMIAKHLSLIHI